MQAVSPRDPRAAEAREFIVAVLSSPGAVVPIGHELPFLNSAAELIRSRNVLPPAMQGQVLRDLNALAASEKQPFHGQKHNAGADRPGRLQRNVGFVSA
jgi:hypothetical protein